MALSKHQRFTTRRVQRSLLKEHPDNPRTILPKGRRALKAVLKSLGLVESLVWNERTGHLLGGHQRVAILDELERGRDYELDVCVVDVPPEREGEILVALNNQEAQGMWDHDRLHALLATPGLVLESTGFALTDLPAMFESHPLIAVPEPPLAAASAVNDQKPPPEKPKGGKGVPGANSKTAEDYRADIEGYRQKTDDEAADCGYFVVLCASLEERAQLADALGVERDARYVEARAILERFRPAPGE